MNESDLVAPPEIPPPAEVRSKSSVRSHVLMWIVLASWLLQQAGQAQENKPEYRGVSAAELQDDHGNPKSGADARIIEMGDRLIVEVSNLDGLLYALVLTGNFPNQEWFDPAISKDIANMDLGTLYQKTALGSTDPQKELLMEARRSVENMLSDVEQRLYLQLGPSRLRHLHAEDPLARQSDTGVFRFVFLIHDTPEDRAEWNKLRSIHGKLRPVSISLAFDVQGLTHTLRTQLGSSLDSTAAGAQQQFKFSVYSCFWLWGLLLVCVIVLVIFCLVARAPNLLRDPDGPLRGDRHIFSLSRCQLAWWFFIVLAAWGFLWVTTSSRDTLNQTALIVTGISGATMISGALAGKVRYAVSASKEDLSKFAVVVTDRPKLFQSGLGAFLYDILSDKDTVDFHRFQLLVWNVVLGVVFLSQTWSDFAMPEFNAMLLGLLGLSAATFVGMKMTPT
jgi:hypothetical protein